MSTAFTHKPRGRMFCRGVCLLCSLYFRNRQLLIPGLDIFPDDDHGTDEMRQCSQCPGNRIGNIDAGKRTENLENRGDPQNTQEAGTDQRNGRGSDGVPQSTHHTAAHLHESQRKIRNIKLIFIFKE